MYSLIYSLTNWLTRIIDYITLLYCRIQTKVCRTITLDPLPATSACVCVPLPTPSRDIDTLNPHCTISFPLCIGVNWHQHLLGGRNTLYMQENPSHVVRAQKWLKWIVKLKILNYHIMIIAVHVNVCNACKDMVTSRRLFTIKINPFQGI